MKKLTASELQSIKQKVVTELARRRCTTGSLASYLTEEWKYEEIPVTEGRLKQEHYSKIIEPLRAINPTDFPDTGDLLIDLSAYATRLNTWASVSDMRSTAHGCVAACTGWCSSTCYGACGVECGGSCTGTSLTRYITPGFTCSNTCSGGCQSAATCGDCGVTCASSCTGCSGCSGCTSCTGNCENNCLKQCIGTCSGSCSADCTGSCQSTSAHSI